MLYGPNGSVVARSRATRAERNPETEAKVREQLRAIDGLLDIVYVEWAGRYALVCTWPQIDLRWPMFERGEIGAPYDTLGWFCQDMQDPESIPVDVDSIEQLVLERLASCDNTRTPWKTRMGEVIEKNRQVKKQRQQIALEQVEDVARTLHNAAGHVDDNTLEGILKEVSEGKS